MGEEIQKHIIIIGGGVMGACSAYFLSKNDFFTITLIEKTDIACAASGKSGGFLALDWNDDTYGLKELSRASYQLHRELANELDGEKTYGYRAMDTYSVVFDTSRNKPIVPTKPVDWINETKVRSFEQIGSVETTAQLHPELFTKKLVEEAEKTGRVDVRVGAGVTELLYEGTKVIGVLLDNSDRIIADKVVVCMGPWSGKLPLLDQEPIAVEGSHVHSIVLKPSEDTIPNHALFTAIVDKSGTSEPEVYPRPDGTVYMCGALDKEPLPQSASLVAVDPNAIDSLLHQASCVSSHLEAKNAQLLKKQACYLPLSVKTALPLIGPHPYYKDLYLATGHSFWGILNAPITGKLIFEWIVNGSVASIDKKASECFLL